MWVAPTPQEEEKKKKLPGDDLRGFHHKKGSTIFYVASRGIYETSVLSGTIIDTTVGQTVRAFREEKEKEQLFGHPLCRGQYLEAAMRFLFYVVQSRPL